MGSFRGTAVRIAAGWLLAIAQVTGALSAVALMPALALALETDPQVSQAERTLRSAELRTKPDPTALELYRKASTEAESALSRNPDSAGANFVYFAATGRVLLADGVAKNLLALRALDRKYLDRALSLDPRYPNALAAKGGVLLDLPTLIGGDPAAGLKLLERAIALNPGGPGTRVSLARALARNGDVDEARRQVRRAAHLACIQGRRKVLDEALALIDQIDPEFAKASGP
ncbi:MAG TPA: tetratricopeptide repeat protein [Candidatus Binatia bacterium]|jgi:tetratricopeptide (TPR) repeat protein